MIKLEICVLCEKMIQMDDEDPNWWGYDAAPIEEGTCCFDCWLYEVFKAQLIAVNAPQSLLDLLERD